MTTNENVMRSLVDGTVHAREKLTAQQKEYLTKVGYLCGWMKQANLNRIKGTEYDILLEDGEILFEKREGEELCI